MKETNILMKAAFWLAIVVILSGFAAESRAATYTVDTTSDSPSQSACTSALSDCSLRGAIARANAGGTNTINFALIASSKDCPPRGICTIDPGCSAKAICTITLTGGHL